MLLHALHRLPLPWMTLAVFGFTYLGAAFIYALTRWLSRRGLGPAFHSVSPGILSPLGTVFGLFIAFVSVQVWESYRVANSAVMREASALRTGLIFSTSFKGGPDAALRAEFQDHIKEAVTLEWPAMADRKATMSLTPRPLTEAMETALALQPTTKGQQVAQQELIRAIEDALDARRQRIAISESHVSVLKWACLYLQAFCAFFIIAAVHDRNRGGARTALIIFATGVAAAVLLILAYDQPFTGEISVSPEPLFHVMPEAAHED